MSKSVETPDYGKWSEKGLPHKGWVWESVRDLEEPIGACEMCGTSIRYVHTISHEDVDEYLEVGCVCASHLTEDHVNPQVKEKGVKSKTAKLKTLQKTEWYETEKGYSAKVRGFRCTVFRYTDAPYVGWWKCVVSPKDSEKGKPWFSGKIYRGLECAKHACYERIIDVKGKQR